MASSRRSMPPARPLIRREETSCRQCLRACLAASHERPLSADRPFLRGGASPSGFALSGEERREDFRPMLAQYCGSYGMLARMIEIAAGLVPQVRGAFVTAFFMKRSRAAGLGVATVKYRGPYQSCLSRLGHEKDHIVDLARSGCFEAGDTADRQAPDPQLRQRSGDLTGG